MPARGSTPRRSRSTVDGRARELLAARGHDPDPDGARSSAAPTGCACRCPTTRSRGTWRTCRRSCRTRACSTRGSSCADEPSDVWPRSRDEAAASARVQCGSRSSIVGSASRSACTLRTNSSSSVDTTRSFAFRFSRSRARRASAPTRRSNLGHSAATTMPMPIASSTIHGQLTDLSVPGYDRRGRVPCRRSVG